MTFEEINKMTGKEFNIYFQKLSDSLEKQREAIKDYRYCVNLIKRINQLLK